MPGSPYRLMPPSLVFAGRLGYHLQLKTGKLRAAEFRPDSRAGSQRLSHARYVQSVCSLCGNPLTTLLWTSPPGGTEPELPDPMRKVGPVSSPGGKEPDGLC